MSNGEPNTSLTSQQIGQAIKSYFEENCPACGSAKARRLDPLCSRCFTQLPADLQEKISTKEHFIGAFHPAMEYLTRGAATAARTDSESASGAKSG